MQAAHKKHVGGLELSRLTLASLAVWLAVTCLVACSRMPAGTATAAAAATGRDPAVAATAPGEFAVASESETVGPATDEIALNPESATVIRTAALAAVAVAPAGANRFVFPED